MKLLLSHKNELFKIIEECEFQTPGQFILTESSDDDNRGVTINLKNSDYTFSILNNNNDYHSPFIANYVPGLGTYREISGGTSWDGIIHQFYEWLENVSRELKEPNYWERLKLEISSINFSTNLNNSKFSIKEYNELKHNVETLSHKLSSIPLLAQQQIEIRSELDRLILLATDLGKFDWFSLFIGTIISIIIQLNVTKDNAELLWSLIKYTFNIYALK